MKKILFSVFAVAALASCAQDEIVGKYNQEAIGFGNAFVDNATKAASDPSYGTTDKPLDEFKVWGTVKSTSNDPVAIFGNGTTGDTVEGTVGEGSVWNCKSKTQYWIEGAEYNFAAVVDGTVKSLGEDLLPAEIEFTATDGAVDLLYAKSDQYIGKPTGKNVKVEFTFSHLLSKVKFTVKNNSSEAVGYSFKVHSIVIKGATAGTCAVPAITWDGFTTGDINFKEINIKAGETSTECEAEKLLIPKEVTISFKVDIICNGETITTTSYPKSGTLNHTLVAGNSYNFNINVSVGDPIQFTVTTNPTWANGNTHDSTTDDDDVNDYVPAN